MITSLVSVVWRLTLCTSTIGDSPVTTTVSCTAPIFSSALMLATNVPSSWMSSRRTVENPGRENVKLYVAAAEATDAVRTVGVSGGGADLLDQVGTGGFHGHAGQDGAGRVLHNAGNRRLGGRHRRCEHKDADEHETRRADSAHEHSLEMKRPWVLRRQADPSNRPGENYDGDYGAGGQLGDGKLPSKGGLG